MRKYTFTCSCEDRFSVSAENEDEAKVKLRELLTEDVTKAHFAEKHPGQTMPLYEDFMAMVILVEESGQPTPMS